MRELKDLYNTFKDSGDLTTLYPEMTGDWEADKEEFAKQMKPAAQAFQADTEELDENDF